MRIGGMIGGRFLIDSKLGREGDEIVWGAFDTKLERHVAIHRFVADPDALRKTQRVRALETFVFDGETWLVSERRKRRRKRSPLVPIALGTVLVGIGAGGAVLVMRLGSSTPTKLEAPPTASASASASDVPDVVVDAVPDVTVPPPSAAKPQSTVTAMKEVTGATHTFPRDVDAWFDDNQAELTKCLRRGVCPPGARIDLSWSHKGNLAWVHPGRCLDTNAAQVCAQKIVDKSHPTVNCDLHESGCNVDLVVVASK